MYFTDFVFFTYFLKKKVVYVRHVEKRDSVLRLPGISRSQDPPEIPCTVRTSEPKHLHKL